MNRKKFESFVDDALAKIPRKFKKRLENVVFLVEDHPRREVFGRPGKPPLSAILGTYHGVPYKYRGPFYGNMPPDVIVIYQKPIEALCRTEDEVRSKVNEVVRHEVGHYFGMSEEELYEIEKGLR